MLLRFVVSMGQFVLVKICTGATAKPDKTGIVVEGIASINQITCRDWDSLA